MHPRECLDSFLRSMLEWETKLDRLRRSDAYRNDSTARHSLQGEARDQLAAIFDRHLTARARKKLTARLDTLGTQRPPEFDMRIEDELDSTQTTAHLHARQNRGCEQQLRFSLVEEGGCWRIDSAAIWREAEQRWEKVRAL